MNDLISWAMQLATRKFGDQHDGVFNAACFSEAWRQVSGVETILDGYTVLALLHGRADVEALKGGSHFRMILPSAQARPYPPAHTCQRERTA